MKQFNYIGKSFLVLTLIYVGLVSAQGRWEIIATTKQGSYMYIDTESIIMLSPGHYLIWEKGYPLGKERQSFMERELKGFLDADKFTYYMSRVEINCSTMKFRIHSSTYYTDGGEVIRNVSELSKWEDSSPGSVGETISKRVCTKGYDAKEM